MNTVGPTIASLQTVDPVAAQHRRPLARRDLLGADRPGHVHLSEHHLLQGRRPQPDHAQRHDHRRFSPTEFEISNFNNLVSPIDGTYTFTVSAVGVEDLAGNTGSGIASDTWVLLTTPPPPRRTWRSRRTRRLSRPDRHRLDHSHRHACRDRSHGRCIRRGSRPGSRPSAAPVSRSRSTSPRVQTSSGHRRGRGGQRLGGRDRQRLHRPGSADDHRGLCDLA